MEQPQSAEQLGKRATAERQGLTLLAALADGPKLAREALDDLGDVRIVEEILRRLSSLFEPKPK